MNNDLWIAHAEYGGWLHIYALMLTVGFLVAFAIITFNFYRRRLPFVSLEVGLFIILPCAVLGASFLGKLDIKHPLPFLSLFAFWQPGLSIHGSLLVGGLVGWLYFHVQSKKYQISKWVYADVILPGILIGQAIGRWGNFFNHELLGAKTSWDSLQWLPSFIKDSLFKWYIPHPIPDNFLPTRAQGRHGQAVDPSNFSHVQYFQPLFLYESLVDVALFFIIVFLLPYLVKQWSYYRAKPSLTQKNFKVNFRTYYQDWYLQVKVSQTVVKNLKLNARVTALHHQYQKNILKLNWWQKIGSFLRLRWHIWSAQWQRDSRPLNRMHNPYSLIILYSGAQGALYWLGYNLMRFMLETQRADSDLFIHHMRWLDYVIILLLFLFGCGLLWCSQLVSVTKFRDNHWLYEKQY